MSLIKTLKRSNEPSKVPLLTDLVDGELALNTYDGKIFFKKTVGSTSTIVPISSLKVSLIDGGSSIDEISNVGTLRFDQASGFLLENLSNGDVKVSSLPADTFKFLEVASQDTLVADGLDTITVIAGSGVNLTTNATTKELEIAAVDRTVTLYQDGNLAVSTGTIRWYNPADITITKITARLSEPADRIVSCNVNKNNTTATVVAFSTGSVKIVTTSSIFMTTDDYLTVDIASIGRALPGAGLSIEFAYKFE